MDSFYDVPRRAPVPSSLDKVLPIPVVPEVSMIAPNTQYNSMNPVSYSKWKSTSNTQRCLNKENCNDSFMLMSSTASIIRKQVRFQAPVFKEPSNSNPLKSASTYNTNNLKSDKPHHDKGQVDAPHNFPQTFNPNFNGKTFQQIYMSNMPNRHLDLSILDSGNPQVIVDNSNPKESPSKQVPNDLLNIKDKETDSMFKKVRTEVTNNPVKDMPQTYKEFLTLQKNLQTESKNDSVSDILNYRRLPRHSPLRTDLTKKGPSTNNYMAQPQRQLNKCLVGLEKPSHEISSKVPVYSSEDYRFSCSPIRNEHNKVSQVPNKIPTPLKCDNNTQTTNVFSNPNNTLANSTKRKTDNGVQNGDDNEPSVKDLVKIIQQQNEQLLLLQTQVSNLIERSEKQQRQIEGPSSDMLFSKKYVTSTQHEICANPVPNVHTPRKGPLSKFSIDMMTSFEVSFRRQQNEKIRRKIPDFVNHEPQIQEVTETESTASRVLSGIPPVESSCDRKRIDSSLYLQEPLVVREDCPSPEPSIKIDMNDYDSSDEETADDVPMAIYANVMDQIGKFFKNAQTSTFPRKADNMSKPGGTRKSKNTTMSKVKEATLKHLRSIGVNLASVDDSDSSEGSDISCDYSPSEVSFAVKQLLMKYLPDEYLSKLNNGQVNNPIETNAAPCNPKTNLIPARPEFSFATVQYMKKYNLIGNNNNTNDDRPCDDRVNLQLNDPVLQPKPGHILDITTLKQQPKLL